ncbi:MAG: tetratricopeptide repeat protein, partial [Candidatus Eremiobacterota bacterium]
GKYKEGIKCFDKVLKLDPGNNTTRQSKEKALKALNDKSPNVIAQSQTAEELGNEGTVLTNLGKYEEAVKCLNTALHSNPDCADLWLNRGICYFNLKDYKKALESFSKYTKLTNMDLRTIDKAEKMAEICYGMGLCNYKLGNIKGAAENFKISAQCWEYAETYEALAECYNEMGQDELAQEALRQRDILIQNQKFACELLSKSFNFVLKFGDALNKDIMK